MERSRTKNPSCSTPTQTRGGTLAVPLKRSKLLTWFRRRVSLKKKKPWSSAGGSVGNPGAAGRIALGSQAIRVVLPKGRADRRPPGGSSDARPLGSSAAKGSGVDVLELRLLAKQLEDTTGAASFGCFPSIPPSSVLAADLSLDLRWQQLAPARVVVPVVPRARSGAARAGRSCPIAVT
jgi:hypothetical protein